MLSYLRLCLASSASMIPTLDLLKEPELIGSGSRHYVDKLLTDNAGPVTSYLDLAMDLLTANPSKVPLQCVLEVVASVPKLSAVLISKLDTFKSLQHNSKEDVRELTAQILAVVVCTSYDTLQIDQLINDLCRNLKDKPLEQQHGCILTIGYTIGRLVRAHSDEKSCRESLGSRLSPAASLVIDFLFTDLPHQLTLNATCLAIGEMGRCGPLLDSSPTPDRAIEKLMAIVNDAKTNGRIREKAALAAGFLSLGELHYPRRQYIIENFLSFAQVNSYFKI